MSAAGPPGRTRSGGERPGIVRGMLKAAFNAWALVFVSPAVLACWVTGVAGRAGVFPFWTHVVAQLPGASGAMLRRAFYRWTLDGCAPNAVIEFGAVLDRRAILERGAHVGAYALVGHARIGERTFVGSRAIVAESQPGLGATRRGAAREKQPTAVTLGSDTWVGGGAIIMANVGHGSVVAPGSVVISPVPDDVMVCGNPAIVAEPTANIHRRAQASASRPY